MIHLQESIGIIMLTLSPVNMDKIGHFHFYIPVSLEIQRKVAVSACCFAQSVCRGSQNCTHVNATHKMETKYVRLHSQFNLYFKLDRV